MKTYEINEGLIGKKVMGIFTATQVTGTITGIVKYYANEWDMATLKPTDKKYVCAMGVKIELDVPVRWGDDLYREYESTARTCDEWGNLAHTKLLN